MRLDELGDGSGSGVNEPDVLPCLPVHGTGSTPDSGAGITCSEASVQRLDSQLLPGTTDALRASQRRMQRAVQHYNENQTMASVDIYARGVPEYRRELLKFAAWVARDGEPKWFTAPESR